MPLLMSITVLVKELRIHKYLILWKSYFWVFAYCYKTEKHNVVCTKAYFIHLLRAENGKKGKKNHFFVESDLES